MKRRRSRSLVAAWAALIALTASGLLLGLGVSSALSQTVPTETTTPTETTPPPPPDPDPIPPPPHPQDPPPPSSTPPPPAGDPSPPPSSGASAAPSKPKKKPAKPDRRPKKERPAETSFAHEPRDPAVLAGASLPSGPSFSNSNATLSSNSGSRLIALFLLAGLAVGGVLLGLAAVPAWILRPARASALIDHWRVQIAATGLSAVCMALIIFLLNTSGL
jgi:outer membrane biosynthesis protein TonB